MAKYIILGLVVVAVVIGLVVVYQKLEKYLGWHQFRGEHGMSYTGFGFLLDFGIEGTYRGYPVQVWVEREREWYQQFLGSGANLQGSQSDRKWTYYEMSLPDSVPGDLAIYEEGMLSDAAETVGAQDIEVGREVFDDYLTVKANDVEGAVEFLERPEVADTILELRNAFKDGFELENGVVRVHHLGMANLEPGFDSDDGSEIEAQGQMEAAFDGMGFEHSHNLKERLDTMIEHVEKLQNVESNT